MLLLLHFSLVSVILSTVYCSNEDEDFSQCGRFEPARRFKIIGGRFALPQEFPWIGRLLAVQNDSFVLCSASLLNSEWAITAAHCVAKPNISEIRLNFGRPNYTSGADNSSETSRLAMFAFVHPNYNRPDYDYALLRLNQQVPFSKSIRPICLPNATICGNPTENLFRSEYDSCQRSTDRVTIAGWGMTDPDSTSSMSRVLKTVDLSLFPRVQCQYLQGNITSRMICAGSRQNGKLEGTCAGDSGGSLVCIKGRNQAYLLGLQSFGAFGHCGASYMPDTFARICSVLDWISGVFNATIKPTDLSVFNVDDDTEDQEPKINTTSVGVTRRHTEGDLNHGWSDMHHAAHFGDLLEVRRIFGDYGITSLTNRSLDGNYPIHLALRNRQFEVVKYMFRVAPQIGTLADRFGLLPGHMAAQAHDLKLMAFFLDVLNFGIETNTSQTALTPLHLAAIVGDVSMVRFLLSRGANLTARSATQGHSALHFASIYDRPNVVSFFMDHYRTFGNVSNNYGEFAIHSACEAGSFNTLAVLVEDYGISVNLTTSFQRSPLHYAAAGGHNEIITFLIDRGANPRQKSNREDIFQEPIHLAATFAPVETIDFLLRRAPEAVNASTATDYKPIHLAAARGDAESVLYFLKRWKIDPNTASRINGRTPLHRAATANVATVHVLVTHGADIALPSNERDYSFLPIHFAASSDKVEIVRYFINLEPSQVFAESDLGQNPLHIAATSGALNVTRFLIENTTVNIESREADNSTALYDAAYFGHLPVVRYLIEKGANMRAMATENQYMPIHVAALRNRLAIVDFLLQKSPELINASSGVSSYKPIHAAAIGGSVQVLAYFLETRNMTKFLELPVDLTGRRPLHLAAAAGELPAISYLLSKGADVFAKSNRLDSEYLPIHMATYYGELQALELLAKYQPSTIVSTDLAGKTVLHIAVENEHFEIVEHLLDHWAVNLEAKTTGDSWSPFLLAVASGNSAMVELLIGRGANVNATLSNGDGALHIAAIRGDLSMVRFLSWNYPYMKCSRNNAHENPLNLFRRSNRNSHFDTDILAHLSAIRNCRN